MIIILLGGSALIAGNYLLVKICHKEARQAVISTLLYALFNFQIFVFSDGNVIQRQENSRDEIA